MTVSFNNSLATDRRLFRAEIRASLAHADALFRAGILTRLETERLKNGLWTMLKRAEHDRHYFDSLPSTDVFSFVESRLFQLTNESAVKLQLGRSRQQRATIALRLWLREEALSIAEMLANLTDTLHDTEIKSTAFSVVRDSFRRDIERVNESIRFLNRMPVFNAQFFNDEQLTEIDYFEIARALSFDGTVPTAAKSFADRDFCLDFIHAAISIMLHLARLAADYPLKNQNPADEAAYFFVNLRAKAAKVFGVYTALLTILNDGAAVSETGQANELVFETVDILHSSLSATIKALNDFNEALV